MSFPRAKIIRFNEGTSCAPPPGTYNTSINDSSKTTPVKTMISKSEETLNSSALPKTQCTRTFSLPVFRTPRVKRKIKLITKSQSLVLEEDKSESIIRLSADECEMMRNEETDLATRLIPSQDKLNIDSEEIIELFKKITELKNKLMISQTSEKELRKQLEEKNNYVQSIKQDQTLIRDNIIDLTEKMRIERECKKIYTDELVSQIKDLKASLQNVLTEKDDLETVIDGMKSAFLIINDKYLLLEKEFNKIKEERDLKVREVNVLNLKVKTESFNEAALNIEVIVNEVGMFFKQMENEFHSLKTQFSNNFVTTISSMHDSVHCEMENMTKQILNGLCKLNEFCITTNSAISEFSEDIGKIFEQYSTVCDLLTTSELEKEDLEVNLMACKNILIEIQNENAELQCNLNKMTTKLKNYEIASVSLHNTIEAISKRLIESDKEVERLNNIIFIGKVNTGDKYINQKQIKSLKDKSTNTSDTIHIAQGESNNCLLKANSKAKSKDDLNDLVEISTTANNMLSCVQMENNSLKLQLTDLTEHVSKLETQKADKDVKLSELGTKVNEQAEIIEKQTQTIDKLHVLLNHQHEDMMRIHVLQTNLENEEDVILLEENLCAKNQELIDLKRAYDEQLQSYTSLIKENLQKDEVKCKCNILDGNGKELKIQVHNLEQNVKELENSLKTEKQRNTVLESEIKSLQNTIREYEKEKENLQNLVHKPQSKKEEYKLTTNSKKTRTRVSKSQSQVLKERNK